MIVNWTDNAIEHLVGIYGYVGLNSPSYARKVVDRITRRSEQLAAFPLSGRIVPEYALKGIREIIEGSYRIIYHVKRNRIDVIAVVHGAQPLPPLDG